jgi:SAM-dependent methyltransferase
VEDRVFYREMAARNPGAVLDLGCGSGRLFASFLAGGATRVVGVDGSLALLERAESRIAADPQLSAARAAGRIELARADVRSVRRDDRFSLAVLAGVISHLDGAADARLALLAARGLLVEDGALIVDVLGPGGLPSRDLPLSVDWERMVDGRRIRRSSRIEREPSPDGLRVTYETLSDLEDPDGTIARLPARFSLWYPSSAALSAIADEAGLEVEATFGSYDLDPLDEVSDRCIAVMRRATATPGRG